MGKSQLEILIEKATNENNVNEDWALYMDIIDFINHNSSEKDALRIMTKRLYDKDPHVSLHTISLLNACVKNCRKNFKLEVCSRVFIDTTKQFILNTSHPKLSEKFASMIKNWCNEAEFQNDPALNLMQSLYLELIRNGVDFGVDENIKSMKSKSSAQTAAQKEEEDLAKAIALSIKESSSSQSLSKSSSNQTKKQDASSSLFGSLSQMKASSNEKYKVKALYDFEAVDDNEITFRSGDILTITDDSDQNWWKGIDKNRKEGLFPSNFVTSDLDFEEEEYESNGSSDKKVSFNDQVNVKVMKNEPEQVVKQEIVLIDEKKIDDCINLLQNADPTGEIQPDSQEMLHLEDQCYMMGPLIDQQLQKIDFKHAGLESLNFKILESFQMYNNLMKESITRTNFGAPPAMTNLNQSNLAQQQQNQNYIPFVTAPPQNDPNSQHLANQLNNFSNYGMNMPPNDMQQNTLPQEQYANNQYVNYNTYQQQQPQQYSQAPQPPQQFNN